MRINHNKKAMSSYVVVVFFAVVSFLLLLPLVSKAMTTDFAPKTETCKLSLMLDGKTNDIPFIADKIHTSCQTIPIGEEITKLGRESRIKLFVANRMADAWGMVHEGNIKELWDSGAFGLSGYNCFVVFDIDYTNPSYKTTITKENMTEYFITEEFTKKKMSYHSYIQSYRGAGAWYFLEDLEPGYHYAISVQSPRGPGTTVAWKDWIIKKAMKKVTGRLVYSAISNVLQNNVALFADPDDLNTIVTFSTLDFAVSPEGLECDYN